MVNARLIQLRRLAHILPIVLFAVCAQAQNTVELRSSVRLGPDQPVRLSDVATLSGSLVDQLGHTLIVVNGSGDAPADGSVPQADSGWLRIEAETIRTALRGVLGDRADLVLIRGSDCHLRRIQPASEQPQLAQQSQVPLEQPDATSVVELETVRGRIARRIAVLLDTDPASLRLRFNERDNQLLDTLVHGRVVDIRPTAMGARLPMSVRVFEGNRIITEGVTQVEVDVKRSVAVVARPVARNSIVVADDLTADTQWLRADATVVKYEDALGRVARGPMSPGSVVKPSDVHSAVLIRRGDLVNVDVVAGTVVVTVEARAKQDGREGEQIELEFKDDRTRTLQATVHGAGRAVSSSLTGSNSAQAPSSITADLAGQALGLRSGPETQP
jgi:flagella basal body P-ring formation protein FlgA